MNDANTDDGMNHKEHDLQIFSCFCAFHRPIWFSFFPKGGAFFLSVLLSQTRKRTGSVNWPEHLLGVGWNHLKLLISLLSAEYIVFYHERSRKRKFPTTLSPNRSWEIIISGKWLDISSFGFSFFFTIFEGNAAGKNIFR